MRSTELLRDDGMLHDLAIERRIAGELDDHLTALFDAHIDSHAACRARYEAALQHQSQWVPPPLPSVPLRNTLFSAPQSNNHWAANRPMSHFVVPAIGISAAAAALALFIASDVDPEQLTTRVKPSRAADPLSLEVTPSDSPRPTRNVTLRANQPGHAAVIQPNNDGTFTVIHPVGSETSVPVQTDVTITLSPSDASKPLVGFHCPKPFRIASLAAAASNLTPSARSMLPAGCVQTR